jgi:hypothetical protein
MCKQGVTCTENASVQFYMPIKVHQGRVLPLSPRQKGNHGVARDPEMLCRTLESVELLSLKSWLASLLRTYILIHACIWRAGMRKLRSLWPEARKSLIFFCFWVPLVVDVLCVSFFLCLCPSFFLSSPIVFMFMSMGWDCFWTAAANGPIFHPTDKLHEKGELQWNDIDGAESKN